MVAVIICFLWRYAI